ncbi:MAG: VOC family protein [Bacteroidales bacterium]|jgi:methylmalonyl-CoA/ethylmalonyl-CoA epimerase|nr:VOC family protein [Bacteroidales bacterium]
MLDTFTFHHIGYAVNDIVVTAEYYVKAGWQLSEVYHDNIQNSKIAFLTKSGFPLIELVAAVDESSPVVSTLKKSGVSPYHICYEVEDIETAIKDMKHQRYLPLFKPVPAVALDNRLICYLYNKNVGLIELLNKR